MSSYAVTVRTHYVTLRYLCQKCREPLVIALRRYLKELRLAWPVIKIHDVTWVAVTTVCTWNIFRFGDDRFASHLPGAIGHTPGICCHMSYLT